MIHRLRGRISTIQLAIMAVLGFVLFLELIVALPKLLVPPLSPADLRTIQDPKERIDAQSARLKAENDVRTTLLQSLGGAVLLLSAYFTWRQLQVNREGQITDRFTKAIDQLAREELDVRLGGIYALERISNESATDRAAIGEILSAYVRTRAPVDENEELDWDFETSYTEDGKRHPLWESSPSFPALGVRIPDVQAAIAVVGRRPPQPGRSKPLQLSHVDLRKVDSLEGAHLERANLASSLLAAAALRGAQLQEANLTLAFMPEADLAGSNLRGARFDYAWLEGAHLEHTDCTGANFTNAHLLFAFFEGADLRGADMSEANLIAARLANVKNLESATLTGARAGPDTTWPPGFDPWAAGVILPPAKSDERGTPSPG